MKQILENLYTWSIYNEEKQLNFNGLYLKVKEDWILMDPPSMSEEDFQFVEKTGKPQKIYLTNKHHTRASEIFRKRWESKIFIHEKDQALMEISTDGAFQDGEILEGEFQVIHIPDAKTPGESAFFWPSQKTLILGDAVIGKPTGSLSMLPNEKFKDPKLAREGLRVLAGLDFEILLLGDGAPLLHQAKDIFSSFL